MNQIPCKRDLSNNLQHFDFISFIFSSLDMVAPQKLRSVFQGTTLKLIQEICNTC